MALTGAELGPEQPNERQARRRAGEAAERGDLDGRGMAQGQLLTHRPSRVADGRNQAQHHADERGTTAVRLRDADHENTGILLGAVPPD